LLWFLFWWPSSGTHQSDTCKLCGRRQRSCDNDAGLASCMIFAMLPFLLYFVTGVVTGFHVYTLLALTVYGAPFNPLELVSLLGSLCLLLAAYVSLYKPHAAARIALLAALTIWSFYGPAIAKSLRTKFDIASSAAQTNRLSSESR
jgi:phosphoglycerol transferase MdoB-like AlkP superfamily enzyme